MNPLTNGYSTGLVKIPKECLYPKPLYVYGSTAGNLLFKAKYWASFFPPFLWKTNNCL